MRLFRDLFFYYILGGIGAIAVSILLSFTPVKDSPAAMILEFIPLFIWILLLGFLLNRVAAKRIQKIYRQRAEDCCVAPYIALLEKWCRLKIPQNQMALCRIALSTGYIETGEFEKARRILQEMPPAFSDTADGMFAMAGYYNNYALCLLHEKNAPGAAVALGYMESAIRSGRLPEEKYKDIQQSHQIKRYLLRMLTGDYDGAMAFFCELAEAESAQMLERVKARYWLGQICLHNRDNRQAAEYLKFAAENGGDTYYAARARALLARSE